MRGRRVLMDSFVAQGVRHIFGNPGTTETPLLDSLPAYPQIEYVMTLHEGVAVSAASFYAQASGRPTVANLHVAPGLGNGVGSLYGALKANSPLVVTAGQRAVNDFDLTTGIYQLQAFKVTGEREGDAAAITAQRNADNVKNIDGAKYEPGARCAAGTPSTDAVTEKWNNNTGNTRSPRIPSSAGT